MSTRTRLVHIVDDEDSIRRSLDFLLSTAGYRVSRWEDATSFLIPEGCAHGFQALTDEVHLIYQHSASYDPGAEGGVRFDDPAIDIVWPLPVGTVSDRDRSFPLIDSSFEGISL